MTDPKDELGLIVIGLRHAAESIRTAVVGWHLRPGFVGEGLELCAELYACAGRYESRLRDYAAVEAVNVSLLRAVAAPGEKTCNAGDDSTAESVISLPEIGTYVAGANVAPRDRIDLLVQALGIVDGIIARDVDDSHHHAGTECWNLVPLRDRIHEFAVAAGM